jgi:hypothetical protein
MNSYASTTGSTLLILNLDNGSVSAEYPILVTTQNGIQELGSSLVSLWDDGILLEGKTQGGQVYTLETSNLVTDRNGTLGYMADPSTSKQPESPWAIQPSPAPATIYNNGVKVSTLPNAAGDSSLVIDDDQLFAEDGNNDLYKLNGSTMQIVGKAVGTHGNIQAMAIQTPEPSVMALIALAGLVWLVKINRRVLWLN